MSDLNSAIPLPPGWGHDELTRFLSDAITNILATFVHKPEKFALLSRIDKVFRRAGAGLDNDPNFIPAVFLHRAHNAFLGAVRMAASGQIPETFPLIRSSIEYALYAHHIALDSKRGVVWFSRHDGAAEMKACRGEFSYRNVLQSLEKAHPTLGPQVNEVYERTIDFGAHPNERGISASTRLKKEGACTVLEIAQLQEGGPAMDLALRLTADAGVGVLVVFERIFEQRFRFLAIDAEIMQIRQGL